MSSSDDETRALPSGEGSDSGHGTVAVPQEPIADPGLPEHLWRPTDVDEHAEKRAERQVATLFTLSMACTVGFGVAYFALDIGENHTTFLGLGASTVALGLTLAGAMLFLGVGVIHWARKLMADHELVDYRHPAGSSEEDRQAAVDILKQGADESGLGRRPLIRNTLLGAVALVGLGPVIALRDLGPLPGKMLEHTIWDLDWYIEHQNSEKPTVGVALQEWWESQGRTQQRVVRDVTGTWIRASDLEIGDLVNAEPESIFATTTDGHHIVEGADLNIAKSKAAVILLRMEPDDMSEKTANWSVEGIVAYSKICTHVGCPISLNERTTHHLLCPCHQSTFDLADHGKVVFGPAARSLPQLPITVDDEGYLVAQSDFREPVGPSYWERDS